MTEQSIFELLLGKSGYDQDNRDDINPLLIPDVAAKICNRLAADINASASHSSYRADYMRNSLLLIKKLCKNNENHYHVNSINRSMSLSCLEKTYKNQYGDDMTEIIDRCVQEIRIEKRAILDGTKKEVFKKQEQLERGSELMLETIRMKLNELGLKSGLEFNFSLPTTMTERDPNHQIYGMLGYEEEFGKKETKLENSDGYRLKRINFGYALINVGHKEDVSKHLKVLLKDLCRSKKLYNYEQRFCRYLFEFIGKYPDLLEFYTDKFFFILEIIIMDTCKILIAGNEKDCQTFLIEHLKSKEINSLIDACKRENLLYNKIKNTLYTLYYYSNFNERILYLVDDLDILVLWTV